MVAISEASAAIGSIKAAIDIAKGVVGLKSSTDINLAVIDIQKALLDAQSAAFDERERLATQQARIAELEAKLDDIGKWEKDRSRYQLMETATGVLIYTLKKDCANGEPDHRLCVKCFDEGRKSILQVDRRHGGGERVECHHCNIKMTLSPFPPVQVNSARARSSWMA